MEVSEPRRKNRLYVLPGSFIRPCLLPTSSHNITQHHTKPNIIATLGQRKTSKAQPPHITIGPNTASGATDAVPKHQPPGSEQCPVVQLRFLATHRYSSLSNPIAPGSFAITYSGEAHQICRTINTTASAPPVTSPDGESTSISVGAPLPDIPGYPDIPG